MHSDPIVGGLVALAVVVGLVVLVTLPGVLLVWRDGR
jgi:hypothetical protein